MLQSAEKLIKEMLSDQWQVNIFQEAISLEYKIQVGASISLDRKNEITQEKIINAFVGLFEHTEIFQHRSDQNEKDVAKLKERIEELNRYKIYYDMHRGMVGAGK